MTRAPTHAVILFTSTVAAALAVFVVARSAPSPVPSTLADGSTIGPRGELAPDPAAVHYRHPIQATSAATSDLATAIKALEAQLVAQPGSPMTMADLADLYYRRAQLDGDPDGFARAEELAKRSIAILPYPNPAPLTLGKVANARHEFRQAIDVAHDILTRSKAVGALVVMATAYLALGELGEASGAAESAVTLSPSSSTYLMRALVLQAQGRDPEAAFDFQRAAQVESAGDPDQASRVRTLWGRFLLRRGELAGARLLFDEALRIVPGSPLAFAQQAELALRSGDAAAARTLFEQAFAGARQVRYLIDLARAQELAGDAAAADGTRAQAEKIVRAELGTNSVGHQLDLVELLVDRGHPDDLAEAITRARAELRRRPSADTRFQLARALYRAGQKDEAAVHVHAALALGQRDARLYELASRVEPAPRNAMYGTQARAFDPGGSGWRTMGMDPVASSK